MATVDRKSGSKPPRKPPVTSEILDRQPPRNLDAEKAVLGSILLLPHVCDDVALVIKPDDFYDDANRCIFEHFLELQSLSRQIDMALLVDRLRNSGDYEKIGGAGYLAEIARSVPTAANAIHYANIVHEKSLLRG